MLREFTGRRWLFIVFLQRSLRVSEDFLISCRKFNALFNMALFCTSVSRNRFEIRETRCFRTRSALRVIEIPQVRSSSTASAYFTNEFWLNRFWFLRESRIILQYEFDLLKSIGELHAFQPNWTMKFDTFKVVASRQWRYSERAVLNIEKIISDTAK